MVSGWCCLEVDDSPGWGRPTSGDAISATRHVAADDDFVESRARNEGNTGQSNGSASGDSLNE